MMNRVVVMGGSFNPPTQAHLQLMKAGIEAVDACQGIFVPTAHDYVLKKMKRQNCPQDTLSEEIRFEMLESFCREDSRLSVSRIQFDNVTNGSDFEMLNAIQIDYPKMEIYEIIGSDKLRFKWITKLSDSFRILVAKRGMDDLDKIKEMRPNLAERWNRFTVLMYRLISVKSALALSGKSYIIMMRELVSW